MKKSRIGIYLVIFFLLIGGMPFGNGITEVYAEDSETFMENWLFSKDASEDGYTFDYDDRDWREVDLPHDWSIEEEFTAEGEAESGFLPGGHAWYRKHFSIAEEDAGKHVTVTFEGVYMNATVYINGTEIGYHPYGYTQASYDLSAYLRYGEENLLAVKVENDLPNSRWYSGSGIERNVYLTITDPVCLDRDGIYITMPDLADTFTGETETNIETALTNHGSDTEEVIVRQAILDEEGNTVSTIVDTAVKLTAGEQRVFRTVLTIDSPHLWSVEDPYRYQLYTVVMKEDEFLEESRIDFGYRWFVFDRDTGFSLNGEPMKLQGVCLHHDQGALGGVSNRSAIERQVRIMKEMGANAIRSTHNPASSELLDVCSEMGMLLIDEAFDTWALSKNFNFNDYGAWFNVEIEEKNTIEGKEDGMTWAEYDVKAMVRSARNEPSVILWSIGNEILGNIGGDTSAYPQYSENLCTWIRELDDTRPLTIGDNMMEEENETQNAMNAAIVSNGGVIGFNYALGEEYDIKRENHPDWIIYSSETVSAYGTRGTYSTFGIDNYYYEVSSYDTAHVDWGSTAEQGWLDVISRDYVAGEFVWTGFDYLGEPQPWNGLTSGSVTNGEPMPKSSYFGIVDTAGLPKDSYYFYQSQWNDDVHTLHILPNWDYEMLAFNADGSVPVVVYSDAASVELFLNGVSMGRQYFETNTTDAGYTWQSCEGSLALQWNLWYETGVLEAVAYDAGGNVIENTEGRNRVVTSGDAAGFDLKADCEEMEADGKSLAYITVELVDADGDPSWREDYALHFTLEGNGRIIGVDNGSPVDLSSYRPLSDTEAERDTYHGMAVVIVESTDEAGRMILHVESEGLQSSSVTITTTEAEAEEEFVPAVAESEETEYTGGDDDMMNWLYNNWFVLFIFGLFFVLLGGYAFVQYRHYKRGDFKKLKEKRWY